MNETDGLTTAETNDLTTAKRKSAPVRAPVRHLGDPWSETAANLNHKCSNPTPHMGKSFNLLMKMVYRTMARKK
jgi:hypothetical protein